MQPRTMAYLLITAGIVFLVSFWGQITRVANAEIDANADVVTRWSASGSPQADRLHTRQFMFDVAEEAAGDEDINAIQANLYFSGSGNKQNVVYASFLSGKPPDTVNLAINQLDDYIAAGLIRPLDDLLEREQRIRKRRGLPAFEESLLGGELELLRYVTNLNDWRIKAYKEDGSFAQEAANLLKMHGKLVGFTPMGFCQTLTYNKRLFKECAAAGGKFAILVDEQGEARPPKTWRELRQFAALISEWGEQTFGAESGDRPYGLIVQGQRPRDIMRAIEPLAATAGTRGFDFAGDTWLDDAAGKKVGRYRYDSPAMLGALKLMLQIKADGSVMPGTLERSYEEPRILLAKGRAAMLIDGWHAALIGCQNVPTERKNIGSAAIPMPYGENDDQEKQALAQMLGMPITRGANYRDMGTGISAITTGSQYPEAMWDWLYRDKREPTKSKESILSHFSIPTNRELARLVYTSQEAEWVTFREKMQPFQFQVWPVINNTQIWPIQPVHGPVQPDNHLSLMHAAYKAAIKAGKKLDDGAIDDIVAEAKTGLTTYSAAVNEDLAKRIKDGLADPAAFTFKDWDPANPQRYFTKQRSATGNAEASQQVAALTKDMPAELQGDVQMIMPPGSPLILCIFAMIVLTVGGYAGWTWISQRGTSKLQQTKDLAKQNWHAYAFILPAFIALFVFVLFPAVYSFYLSFHSGTGQTSLKYVGLENYGKAFVDDKFWTTVLPNTVLYMLVVAIGEVALGLLLASLLNLPLRGMAFYRTMFFIPLVVSMAVVAVVFYGLLQGQNSTLNVLLDWIGFYEGDEEKIKWLTDEGYALYTVIGIAIWHGLPYNTILCLAGLQSISKDLYEAAKVDGAGPIARFWRITIPQLTPILIIIVFNSLVGAARHFGTVFILTEGEYETEIVSTYIYKSAFFSNETQVGNVGYAATLSILYAVMLAALTIVNVVYVAKRMRRRLQQAESKE